MDWCPVHGLPKGTVVRFANGGTSELMCQRCAWDLDLAELDRLHGIPDAAPVGGALAFVTDETHLHRETPAGLEHVAGRVTRGDQDPRRKAKRRAQRDARRRQR